MKYRGNFRFIGVLLSSLLFLGVVAAHDGEGFAFDIRMGEGADFYNSVNEVFEFTYESSSQDSEFEIVNYGHDSFVVSFNVYDAIEGEYGLKPVYSNTGELSRSIAIDDRLLIPGESIQAVPFEIHMDEEFKSYDVQHAAIEINLEDGESGSMQPFFGSMLFVSYEPIPGNMPVITGEEVQNYISDHSNGLGVFLSVLGLILFLLGVRKKRKSMVFFGIILVVTPWVYFSFEKSSESIAVLDGEVELAEEDALVAPIVEDATSLEKIEVLVVEAFEVVELEQEDEGDIIPEEVEVVVEEELPSEVEITVTEVAPIELILAEEGEEEEEEKFANLDSLQISELLFENQSLIGLELWNADEELRVDFSQYGVHYNEEEIALEDYLDPLSFYYLEFEEPVHLGMESVLFSLVHTTDEGETEYLETIAYDPMEFYLTKLEEVPDEPEIVIPVVHESVVQPVSEVIETVVEDSENEEAVVVEVEAVVEEIPVVEEELVEAVEEEPSVEETPTETVEEAVVEEVPVVEETTVDVVEEVPLLERIIKIIDDLALDEIEEKKMVARFGRMEFDFGSFARMTEENAMTINTVQAVPLKEKRVEFEDDFLRRTELNENDDYSWTYLIHGTSMQENGMINTVPEAKVSVFSSRYVDGQLELTLSGLSSYDEDGDELEYLWRIQGADDWEIDEYRADVTIESERELTIELTVRDVFLSSSTATMRLVVGKTVAVEGDPILSMNSGADIDPDLLDSMGASTQAIQIGTNPIRFPDYTVSALDQVIVGELNNFTLRGGHKKYDGVIVNMLPVTYENGTVLPLDSIQVLIDGVEVPRMINEDFVSFDVTDMIRSKIPATGSAWFKPEVHLTIPGRTRSGSFFTHVFYTFY